jgi:hypothetical protein
MVSWYYEAETSPGNFGPRASSAKPHSKCEPIGERIFRKIQMVRYIPDHLRGLTLTQLREVAPSLPADRP